MNKIRDWLKKYWKRLTTTVAIIAVGSLGAASVKVNDSQAMIVWGGNLLDNPGFEGGGSPDADRTWWWDISGPHHEWIGNVSVPDGWNVWWKQDTPCCSGTSFDKGRPEAQVIGTTDPERVHDGDQALKMFTFWRCHEMGVFQQVYVQPGHYRFSVYAHSWHSNCDRLPHSMPYDDDCTHVLWDSWDRMKVGIGNEEADPWSDGITWGDTVEQYGVYGSELSVTVKVTSPMTVTAWFASECNWPLKHGDVYLDSAVLTRVFPIYLPIVGREQ